MKTNGETPVVGTVNNLEPGDLIAFDFGGVVLSGKISSIPTSRMDLSAAQLDYLVSENVAVPNNQWEPIGGTSNRLLLGTFQMPGVVYRHMFLDWNRIVVVFPKEK